MRDPKNRTQRKFAQNAKRTRSDDPGLIPGLPDPKPAHKSKRVPEA